MIPELVGSLIVNPGSIMNLPNRNFHQSTSKIYFFNMKILQEMDPIDPNIYRENYCKQILCLSNLQNLRYVTY